MSLTEASIATKLSAFSRDGTQIGYLKFGDGPGLVIVHGTMSSAHNHVELAEALADAFTVYVVDRRGRSGSGPFPAGYTMATEVEDLRAILDATGAQNVFGVSSGGLIALRAAVTVPAIRRVAVFEPPLFADATYPSTLLERFDRELWQGRVAAALITAMKGTQMGPPIMRLMPHWLLEQMIALAIRQEDRKATDGYVSMRELAPTLHYDFQLVVEASSAPTGFANVLAKVLLLGGSKSPAYLGEALDRFEQILPGAERVELPDVGHAASWNADRGGHPAVVARELRRFFA